MVAEQITAIRQAIHDATSTPIVLSHTITGAVVTEVRTGSDSFSRGFFIQSGATGPALFVFIDPAAVAADLARGDVLDIDATTGAWFGCSPCNASNGFYQITGGTVTRTGRGAPLPAAQPLEGDARFAGTLPDHTGALGWELDAELATVRGTLEGAFEAAGGTLQRIRVATTATAGYLSSLYVRLPQTLIDSLGIAAGCEVEVAATPVEWFRNSAQLNIGSAERLTVISCGPLEVDDILPRHMGNWPPSTPFTITFSHGVDPATATVQANSGTCTGNIQLSATSTPATCLGLSSPMFSSGGRLVTTAPAVPLTLGQSYTLKVLGGVRSVHGDALAQQATSTFTANVSCADHVVISQVYSGGGNAGAQYSNDFVELFNPTASAVTLDGWSVQATNASGSFSQVTALSGQIQSGQFLLVQMAPGSNPSTPLPTPDFTGAVNMGNTSSKAALVSNTTPLGSTCPSTGVPAGTVDFVGWGVNANCFETAAGPASSNTVALHRTRLCEDLNDNSADFSTAAPAPRNSMSPSQPCTCN